MADGKRWKTYTPPLLWGLFIANLPVQHHNYGNRLCKLGKNHLLGLVSVLVVLIVADGIRNGKQIEQKLYADLKLILYVGKREKNRIK